MTVDLHGYSEHGMIWTLFGEIAVRPNASELLAQVLSLAELRNGAAPAFAAGGRASITIEQSFSGFGDADVLIAIDPDDGAPKRCVFIEAKVCCQRSTWSLADELMALVRATRAGKRPFSNLYCQLHAKQRLVQTLRASSGAPFPEGGVPFLERLGFRPRKIGTHRIVRGAVDRLTPYVHDATYIALVPSTNGFGDTLRAFEAAAQLDPMTCDRWAALAWHRVEDFCHTASPPLSATLAAFDHNRGQIYGAGAPAPPREVAAE